MYSSQDKKTAVVMQAVNYIMENPAVTSWLPFIAENNLGIPYSIGIEMGHITELSNDGWDQIDTTYKNLCDALGVERLTRQTLDDIFLGEEIEEEDDESQD